MSTGVVEAIRVTDQHLDPREVAGYVDRLLPNTERARIEAHLVTCPECRAEIAEAGRIIASLPRPRRVRRGVMVSAAGIAAMLLVFLWPRADRDLGIRQHRESPVTTTIAPRILAPIGGVESVDRFVWSSVPHAGIYTLRIFDPDGSVVWQSETSDTVLTPPPPVALRLGRSYYWKVEARTGFQRSTSTDLVEFSILSRRPQ
jgi:putative zinc finger protein